MQDYAFDGAAKLVIKPQRHLERVTEVERAWVGGDRAAARRWAEPVVAAWERAQGGDGWSASAQIGLGK